MVVVEIQVITDYVQPLCMVINHYQYQCSSPKTQICGDAKIPAVYLSFYMSICVSKYIPVQTHLWVYMGMFILMDGISMFVYVYVCLKNIYSGYPSTCLIIAATTCPVTSCFTHSWGPRSMAAATEASSKVSWSAE